jgi:hypothetical protein
MEPLTVRSSWEYRSRRTISLLRFNCDHVRRYRDARKYDAHQCERELTRVDTRYRLVDSQLMHNTSCSGATPHYGVAFLINSRSYAGP